MFTFGERLIDYLQAYECFLGALGLESSFMSFAVGRFCPTPEAADLIVLDFWDNLRKLNPEFPSRFRFYTESEPLPTSLISVSCS